MAAPKQNQFWKLRSKHGRDKLFATPDLMWEAACEYFTWVDNHPFMEVEQKKGNMQLKIGKDVDLKGMKNDIKESLKSTISLPRMRPYTIQGLCLYLDCNTEYFVQFEKALKGKDDESSKDFSLIVTRIRETIYNQKFSGAAAGFFNANIIARDLGLIDKSENKHDVSDEMKALLKPFKSKKS